MSESPVAHDNRRDSFRRRSKNGVCVTCHNGPGAEGPDLAVQFLDASQTGLRMVVREDLRRGEVVSVRLEGPDCATVRRLGNVVWSVPGADGSCCVGIRLQERLPFPVLIRLTEV